MIKWIKSKKSKTVILVLYVVVIEKILQFGKLSFFFQFQRKSLKSIQC